ncbi:TonB-dependent receptor plug domain-containing protein [Novosphingobium sp. G106]|uniref:TonB-dependent receptor plug domain-containing protein n=1 Tax=Novosphingobium sp. G106 TaxID=2849500 RepID=UPI001C2D37D0|nr:TonB-dependent receptor plug domain-containing protein [Novosphingobium sp. G106]MBV1686218.1 TonB-dependent receptor plug domain-containing protein [Novosphingobium sp. G106]
MNVPVAVTALQANTLETRQISDVESLQRIAPSLSAAPFGDGSSQLLTIRGQVAQDIVAAVDPAVGIYIDGVYLGRFTGGNMAFLDVERVEVLRGPQGTLFGRNTIGGAVSITPNHPTDKFEGMVSGRIGNFNTLSLTSVLNIPLGEEAAIRVVGSHTQHDGYAKSAVTGADLNGQNQEYGRASLRADVADGWQLLASADYSDSALRRTMVHLAQNLPHWRDARKNSLGRNANGRSVRQSI